MPFLEPQPSLKLYFSITEPETRKSRLISEGTDLQRRRELVTYDAGVPLDVLFARKLEPY